VKRVLLALSLVLAGSSAACGRTASNPGGTASVDEPGPSGGAASGGGASGSAGGQVKPSGGESPLCTPPGPGTAPSSILLATELKRTIVELFPDADLAAAPWLPEDGAYFPFSAAVLPQRAVDLHALAHDVALRVTEPETIASVSGCDPDESDAEACQAEFLESFLRRAYRRPVTDEDRTEMNAVFAEGQKLGGDFASGVRAVIEVALQNPDFVYLLEQGTGQGTSDAVELTGYETAARLAYFLTGSPPDDELAAAAEQGPLDVDTVETHARRLLGATSTRGGVRAFYRRLLGLGDFGTDDPDLGYTSAIAEFAREETLRFVEDVTFDGAGTFSALLTEPSTWVNEPLATFYGLPGVAGTAFQKVSLDPAQRAGMLTQSAFLRAHSLSKHTRPIQRGLPVLTQLLCYEMPAPPPNIAVDLGEPPKNATTRERVEQATSGVACQGCHRDINPVGFAFEHYDSVGRWRETEEGRPIDASGDLYKTDAQGHFADAVDLAQRIAKSDDAKACFARRWLEQANRRPRDATDGCALSEVTSAFTDSGDNLVELLVAVAKTETFRYRRKSELAP